MLPSPKRERWQPIRSGLVNLYRYDYEEFWYEDGHLLLRGNNGTGKSRVLALQLPFLLDGDVSPHRMEPDGDPSKKAEWNLLLGKHPDRLGYTWIEFGRRDNDGVEHFVTLGCGLSAAEGRGIIGKWFFITQQRTGRDFALLTPQRVPLTKDRLADALGDRGRIYTTAGEYRKAVDDALFQLGERYYPLVNLLVQLRQPQLSRHLDEKKLSEVLSEALPPLSDVIVADVAESFRSLDDDESVLNSLRAAAAGVNTFLKEYERYLQIAALRRAGQVRSAQAAYEATRERLRVARELVTQTGERLRINTAEINRLDLELKSAAATVKTLTDSPEMRDARALDRARQQADERRTHADRANQDLETARGRRSDIEDNLRLLEKTEAGSLARVEESAKLIETGGSAIGIEPGALAAIKEVYTRYLDDERARNSTQRKLEDASASRFRACYRIRDLNSGVANAQGAHDRARDKASEMRADLDNAVERRQETHHSLERETESLVQAYRAWAQTLTELQPADADGIADCLREWSERAEGPSPASIAAAEAESAANRRLAILIAEIERAESAERMTIADLAAEHARLTAGVHTAPAPPYTRSLQSRSGKPGAPLWAVCDFMDSFPIESRGGLEAALEASGLLDAWITPDGRLLDPDDHDTMLVACINESGAGPRLDSVLKVVIDRTDSQAASLSEAVVSSILCSIGFGKSGGHAWVDSGGRWQVGPLYGSWMKPEPEHIGQSARESARRKRLEEIEEELVLRQTAVEGLKAERTGLERRQALASAEARSAPDDSAVRNAVAAVATAALALEESRRRVVEAEEFLSICKRDHRNAIDRRDMEALDLGLTDWTQRIGEFENQIHEFKNALAGFWPAVRAYADTSRNRQRIESMRMGAINEEQRRDDAYREAQHFAITASAERDALESSCGAAVEEILRRVEAAREREDGLRQALKEQRDASVRIQIDEATQNKDVETLSARLNEDTSVRDAACRTLQRFAAARLLEIAVRDLQETAAEWSATRAVEIARIIAGRLGDVDTSEAAWNRSERETHQQVQILIEALQPHGHRPWYAPEDGVLSVTIQVQGKEWTMAELKEDLDGQIRDRQRILDEREREILERHLIGEVSTHLTDLLHRAEELVGRMNDEIESRPMSTGMALRFKWEIAEDGPAGLPEIRKLLLRKDGTWSSGDRQALGRFLQQQIKTVRAEYEVGTWADHLKMALDYRRWHRFVVERQQEGRWQRLTRRTHGTGSGGEKAVALTIPQFAAAAAHYQSAGRLAPRLILLDEAFVGIDNDMRSKCMGLLAAFDLDFIMTSEREWGCYPTLPGLAIYQLSTRQGIDAVGVTRWIWNGRERIRGEKFTFDVCTTQTEASFLQEST